MSIPELCVFGGTMLPLLLLGVAIVAQSVPVAMKSVNRVVEKRRVRDLKVRSNVRRSFPPESELRALARSCMKGMIHPLIILADSTILDGECRYRGMMLEDPDFEFDVIVVDRELTPGEVVELQLRSALLSNTLSSYDQAVACREWMGKNPGATAKELSERIDRDPSMVGKLLSLWKTIPAAVEAAAQDRLGPRGWHQLSLLPEAEQPGFLEMLTSGVPVAQVSAEIARKRRVASASPAAKASKVRCDLPGNVCVVVSGDGVSLDESIEALGEAIKEMKRARDLGYTAKTFAAAMKDRSKKA